MQTSFLPVPGYSRPKKAAEFLDVHLSTLWRKVKAGAIAPPVKFGVLSRFDNEKLLETKRRLDAGELGPSFDECSAQKAELRRHAA